jgi:hypothetical protein
MEERKMTAVQWLIEQIDRNPIAIYKDEIFNQAKQMEKKQIIEAYCECWGNDGGNADKKKPEAEQYYNETFKSE